MALKATARDIQESDDGAATVKRVPLAVTATVAGDRALPVPKALELLRKQMVGRVGCLAAERGALLLQHRSVLYTAGIQCATFHQFSTLVAARETNSKIEGTNKDWPPDLHYLAMPTVAQAFVVGHMNLQVLFEHTAYVGTYGCAYDTGPSRPSASPPSGRQRSEEWGVRFDAARAGRRALRAARRARGSALRRRHIRQRPRRAFWRPTSSNVPGSARRPRGTAGRL